MIITTSVEVSFLSPEEHEAIKKFMADHDMSQWHESSAGWCVVFTKKEILAVDSERYKEEGGEHESRFKPTF